MSGDGDDDWKDALGGVRPLAGRDRVTAPRRPAPAPRAHASEAPVAFEIERHGERVTGRAGGVDRRRLRELARGAVPVDASVDLHGLDAAAAERSLREALLSAHAAGARCVRVIHGRGRHSADGPVLGPALPEWLARPPVGPRVLAFATAPPAHGGPGASYVLLRRAR